MVTVKMEEAGKSFLHEPDEWLPATIDRVEEGDDYGFGPTIRLILHIDGDISEGGEQNETWAMASQKLSPRSKLYGWLKGINPSLLPDVGGTVQLDALNNLRVDVMFEHYDDAGTTKEKAAKFRASKTKAPAKVPTVADKEAPF